MYGREYVKMTRLRRAGAGAAQGAESVGQTRACGKGRGGYGEGGVVEERADSKLVFLVGHGMALGPALAEYLIHAGKAPAKAAQVAAIAWWRWARHDDQTCY